MLLDSHNHILQTMHGSIWIFSRVLNHLMTFVRFRNADVQNIQKYGSMFNKLRRQNSTAEEVASQVVRRGCQVARRGCQVARRGCQVARRGCQVARRGCQVARRGCQVARRGCQVARRGCQVARRGCQVARRGCQVARRGCQVARRGCQVARRACQRFQHLFPNPSSVMPGRTSGNQNLVSIFPGIDNYLSLKTKLRLKAGCLPYAVGKHPSKSLINLGRSGHLKWFTGLYCCLRIFINSLQVFPIPLNII